MSNGNQPIVIQQPGSWIDRSLKIAVIVAMIGGMIFVGTLRKSGKISDEDAANAVQFIKTVGPMLMAKGPDGKTAEQPTISVSDDKSTVVVKPALSAAGPREFSPDDLQKWLPLIQIVKDVFKPDPPTPLPGPTPDEQKLIDEIAQLKKLITDGLKPNPPIPVVPTPVNPVVVPVPGPVVPIPGGSKIVVTDEQNKPITAATVEAGVLFRVSSTIAAGSAGWSTSRNGDVKLITLDNDAGYVCYLGPGAWIEFHLTDYGTRQKTSLRITCNQGGQPPPKPVEPIPTVDVKPTPKPANDLRVLVVYESKQNHSSKQDLILASVDSGKINDALNAKCSKGADGKPNWRRWDKDIEYDGSSSMGTLFATVKAAAVKKGLPAIVVTCGNDSTVYPIESDATEDSVISVLTCGG